MSLTVVGPTSIVRRSNNDEKLSTFVKHELDSLIASVNKVVIPLIACTNFSKKDMLRFIYLFQYCIHTRACKILLCFSPDMFSRTV